jgi:uncharacterized SAM-binding protein YcdF (DUF218 family)
MNRIKRLFFFILGTAGALFLLLLFLAMTSIPFHLWYRLSLAEAGINRPPDCIVILGGGGMPSESGLMRCWYGAAVALQYPRAGIIIALPGDTADSTSAVYGMKQELMVRGVPAARIGFENSGTNTRAQALLLAEKIAKQQHLGTGMPPVDEKLKAGILLVTAPEHLNRAVKTFRHAGFLLVDGLPAFESAIESDISLKGRTLGGRRWVPDLGDNLTIRYRFWTQLRYEMLVIREWMAIGYYWVKGWI